MAFDYRQFLAENKLTKVSKGQEAGKAKILSEGIQIREGFDTEMDDLDEGHKCPECGQDPCVCECGDLDMMEANKQKEDYLKRKEREEKGNWGGSVGAFVEKHGDELGKAAVNRQSLVDYIENVMKPELNDEARRYVDNLVATVKSPYKLLMSLYNATLKGSGLGLDEEEGMSEENLMEMALNHASLGGERSRKKPGVKPGSANQDKMAKSEMKGDEIEVTIGGVKKAVSQRAFNKYRKMTDPEEKKAWKKKHGFIKEGKTLKESLGYTDEVEQDLMKENSRGLENYLRTIWNEYKDRVGDGTLYIDLDKHGATVQYLGRTLDQVDFESEM